MLMIFSVLTFGEEVGLCHYYGTSHLTKSGLTGSTDLGEQTSVSEDNAMVQFCRYRGNAGP